MTNNTATSQSQTVTVTFIMSQYDYAASKNVTQGFNPYEAARTAANWAMEKYGPNLATKEERLELEQSLGTSVLVAREKNIRDYLSSVDPEHIRTEVHTIIGSLKDDTRLENDPRAMLITVARSFLPPIDEAWITKKIENGVDEDDKSEKATQAIALIMNDERLKLARRDELLTHLEGEIAKIPNVGPEIARSFINEHTLPQRPARTSEVRQLTTPKPRRESAPRALDIQKAPEPTLKIVAKATNPIGDIEHEIRVLKGLLKEEQRLMRDKIGGNQERCDEIGQILARKEAERTTLLKAKKTREDAEREARKNKGKKATEESKKSNKKEQGRDSRAA